MSRFLDFLRRIFRVHSPHQHQEDLFAFYKSPEWSAVRQRHEGMTTAFSDIDEIHEYPVPGLWAVSEKPNTQIVHLRHDLSQDAPGLTARECVKIGEALTEGIHAGITESIEPFFNEIHDITRPAAIMYANNRPVRTTRNDNLDAFVDALRRISQAAAEAAAALGGLARAANDACLIDQHGTRQEIHFILHARKHRTRKKYRNRVLRRIRRAEKRSKHDKV